jgi:hypothetical protein
VVDAIGALTSGAETSDLTPYREMRLRRVRTLSGRTLPATFAGWIQTSPYPAPSAPDAPGLWALDGHLVAIVTPRRVAHTTLGPLLSIAPLVHHEVILSAAACWSDVSLPTNAFKGRLREIPGSNAYALAEQAGGFREYPFRQFLRLLL